MSGVLQFALGLNAASWLGPASQVAGSLATLTGGMLSFAAVVRGVWNAIERGGALVDLSNRTGETVSDLYRLEEAFAVVGVSGEQMPSMINRLNKSLSGVGEMGESTVEAFQAMGLSIEQLKAMNAPAQFNAVAAALSRMPREDALDAAGRLFGRGMGESIMQIARDSQGFSEAMASSAREAAVFARTAAAFDTLGDTITRIKGSLSGMFAGIAEGIVPVLQQMADLVNGMDLVGFGKDIGTMFKGAFQAFREGELSSLIAQTISFGIEAGLALAPGLFAKLGYVILKTFETPLIYFQAGLDYVVQYAANKFATSKWLQAMVTVASPAAGMILGSIGDAGPADFGQILEERKQSGVRFNLGTGEFGFGDMNDAANASLAAGWERIKAAGKKLFETFSESASRAPGSRGAVATGARPGVASDPFASSSET
jgi:hypothetical protein